MAAHLRLLLGPLTRPLKLIKHPAKNAVFRLFPGALSEGKRLPFGTNRPAGMA